MATRQSSNRAAEARAKKWKEPNDLEVPELLKEHLASQGYGTRWIRVTFRNEHDGENIFRRQREGYEFVTAEEAEAHGWNFPPVYDTGKEKVVRVGDLALAKLPLEISEDRDRQMADRTRRITQGVNEALYENARENRLLPIRDSSRSQTTTGGSRQVIVDNDDTDI